MVLTRQVRVHSEGSEHLICGEIWDDKMSTLITGEQGWRRYEKHAGHHRPPWSWLWGGYGSSNAACTPLTKTSGCLVPMMSSRARNGGREPFAPE